MFSKKDQSSITMNLPSRYILNHFHMMIG